MNTSFLILILCETFRECGKYKNKLQCLQHITIHTARGRGPMLDKNLAQIPQISTMSEKLCLKWNDFQDNAKNAFQRLRGDKNFTDVTLACEDGEQFEAHKVIMASSSPVFQNLLIRNPHPHPLVYMTFSTLGKLMFSKKTWIPFFQLLKSFS